MSALLKMSSKQLMIIQFSSINLLTCLTTAESQLQASTKIKYTIKYNYNKNA